MDNNRLLILFGPPGTGKNHIGEALAEHFGFTFHDADMDMSPEARAWQQRTSARMPDEMQLNSFRLRLQGIENLLAHPKIAIAFALIRNDQRIELLQRFPWAEFILVDLPQEVREDRLKKRVGHWSPTETAIQVGRRFQSASIPHSVIRGDLSRDNLFKELAAIVGEKDLPDLKR